VRVRGHQDLGGASGQGPDDGRVEAVALRVGNTQARSSSSVSPSCRGLSTSGRLWRSSAGPFPPCHDHQPGARVVDLLEHLGADVMGVGGPRVVHPVLELALVPLVTAHFVERVLLVPVAVSFCPGTAANASLSPTVDRSAPVRSATTRTWAICGPPWAKNGMTCGSGDHRAVVRSGGRASIRSSTTVP